MNMDKSCQRKEGKGASAVRNVELPSEISSRSKETNPRGGVVLHLSGVQSFPSARKFEFMQDPHDSVVVSLLVAVR